MVFVPKLNWQNSPSTATPITAAELIRIENGIKYLQEVKPRIKSSTEWATDNDVLVQDEHGLESDTLKSKIGNGVTPWNSLGYSANGLESVNVNLSEYLKTLDAEDLFSPLGHTHASSPGGNLCPNGDFTDSGTSWVTTDKVGTPVVTYETSPIGNGLAGKVAFNAATDEQVFKSVVMSVPGSVGGLTGTFEARSTKPCTYVVELITSNSNATDPDYSAQPEPITVTEVITITTVANQDTPVSWSAVLPPKGGEPAVKARVAIRIKRGAGQTIPITAYLDNVAYQWSAGSASEMQAQAQGSVVGMAANQTGIVTATPTKLLIDSVQLDRGGYFRSATNRFIVPSQCSGLHTIHAEVPFEVNGTGERRVILKRNSVEVKAGVQDAGTGYPTTPVLNYTADLVNGDILELFAEQNSGGNLQVLASGLGISIVRHDRVPQTDSSPPVDPPVAGFTRSPSSGTAPITVTCVSTATGDISSTQYDFGEGAGFQNATSHTYQGAYSGNITQRVTGPGGSDTTTLSVNISGTVAGDRPVIKSQRLTPKTDAATSAVATLPATAPATGDLMVLFAVQRGVANTFATPAGWTALGSQYLGTNSVCRAWSRVAGASESAPTVSSNTNNAMVVGIIVFTAGSWKTSDPWSVDWVAEGAGAATSSYQMPSVTTQDNNALRVGIAGHLYSTTAPTLTKPEDFVGIGSQENGLETSNNENIAVLAARELVPSAGDAGVAVWTSTSASVWMGQQFAVTAANASTPDPDPTELFPGDPGVGKTYTTWIQHNGSYDVWGDQLELIRDVAYTGSSADPNRNTGLYKDYAAEAKNYNLAGQVGVIQDGRILFLTNNIDSGQADDIVAGGWDNAMDGWITTLNNWRDNHNGVVWWNLLHEPENSSKGFLGNAGNRRTARRAQRYFVDYMKAGGVTNMAFVGPVFMGHTIADALHDFNGGAIRNDPWWEYDPNWKGPETGAGVTGYTGWAYNTARDALLYNPVNFYTSNRYADIQAGDIYCFHWQHSVGEANPSGHEGGSNFSDWQLYSWVTNPNMGQITFSSGHCRTFEGHATFGRDQLYPNWDAGSGDAGQSHGADRHRQALDRIYGTSDADRMPYLIPEWGYPMWQTSDSADPVWSINKDHYDYMFQSLLDNRCVGLCMWKGDSPADVRQADIDSATISTALGTKAAQKNPSPNGTVPGYPTYPYQARYDPTDTRRKLLASWQDKAGQKKKLRRTSIGPNP